MSRSLSARESLRESAQVRASSSSSSNGGQGNKVAFSVIVCTVMHVESHSVTLFLYLFFFFLSCMCDFPHQRFRFSPKLRNSHQIRPRWPGKTQLTKVERRIMLQTELNDPAWCTWSVKAPNLQPLNGSPPRGIVCWTRPASTGIESERENGKGSESERETATWNGTCLSSGNDK